MHYEQLAELIAAEYGYGLDDVVDDMLAIVARHGLDPTAISDEQVARVRFETVARAETVNHVVGIDSDE